MTVQALTCPKCGGNIKPSDTKCPFCGAALVVDMPQQSPGLQPQALDWVSLGDYLRLTSEGRGQETAQVAGIAVYEELWQTQRGGPWVPTGGAFAGVWLETKCFLLSWQDRFYLLDQRKSTSDVNIAKDFAPYAKEFGQSDQKADVRFDYDGRQWRINDIGRFRVSKVSGAGIQPSPGAMGRFIHSSDDSGRVLVVEDYENTSGAQDMVWQGYLIEQGDIQKG
jgi:hypothetical protein